MGYIFGTGVNVLTNGLKTCVILVEKGDDIDKGRMIIHFIKADQYLSLPILGFVQNPSLFQIGYVLRTDRDKGIMRPLKETEIGYKWNYDTDFSQYFFT